MSAINSYLLRASAKDSPYRPPPGEADIGGKMMVGIRGGIGQNRTLSIFQILNAVILSIVHFI
jgi:hypothetical protein